MDIINIVENSLRKFLTDYNINYSNIEKFDNLLYKSIILSRKLIPEKPRKVYISKEVEYKAKKFNKQKELEIFKHIVMLGEDLNCFQSKNIFNLNENDEFYLDTGIYHLHMGFKKDKDRYFVEKPRGDYLLFIFFKNENAYFVDIKKHSEKKLFFNYKMIEILNRNWNGLLDDYKLYHN